MPKSRMQKENIDAELDRLCPTPAPLQNYQHELGRIPYTQIAKGEDELKISDASVSSIKIKKYGLVRC